MAKANGGFIAKNERKAKPNQPDIRGKLTIVCEHCGAENPGSLSGWHKTNDKGSFYGLAFTHDSSRPPRQDTQAAPAPQDERPF